MARIDKCIRCGKLAAMPDDKLGCFDCCGFPQAAWQRLNDWMMACPIEHPDPAAALRELVGAADREARMRGVPDSRLAKALAPFRHLLDSERKPSGLEVATKPDAAQQRAAGRRSGGGGGA